MTTSASKASSAASGGIQMHDIEKEGYGGVNSKCADTNPDIESAVN